MRGIARQECHARVSSHQCGALSGVLETLLPELQAPGHRLLTTLQLPA